MSEVTCILSAIEQGDPHAAAQLLRTLESLPGRTSAGPPFPKSLPKWGRKYALYC